MRSSRPPPRSRHLAKTVLPSWAPSAGAGPRAMSGLDQLVRRRHNVLAAHAAMPPRGSPRRGSASRARQEASAATSKQSKWLLGHAGDQRSTPPSRRGAFLNDKEPGRARQTFRHRLVVEGHERPRVDDLELDALERKALRRPRGPGGASAGWPRRSRHGRPGPPRPRPD